METGRKNPWKTAFIILALLVLAVILAAIMFPVFSRARRAAHRPFPMAYRTGPLGLAEYGGAPSDSIPWSAVLAATAPRMVISTANLKMEVSKVQQTYEKITAAAAKAGGFVTGSGINREDGQETATITLRVPAKRYSSVLAQVSKLGKVLSKEEKGEDVTEEYVDLQSRIRNVRREEEAFLKVLERARKVPDILAVERELSRVRGEIEQAVGRTKFLENQVALATINVELSEPTPTVSKVVTWDISKTAIGAVNALQVVFRELTSLVVWVAIFAPLWILLGIVVYGYRRYARRRRCDIR
ncbi:MAG TPA: DUF4349 domain-containing protein [Armatimonadota bacterium]|nr:DUF4349 domain-containing protein [Armatimonadota bacterium]